jgi:hypothetical protein
VEVGLTASASCASRLAPLISPASLYLVDVLSREPRQARLWRLLEELQRPALCLVAGSAPAPPRRMQSDLVDTLSRTRRPPCAAQ